MNSETNLDQATILQRQAADPSISAWVSANAGAGKTRVLIDRISRLLLCGVQPEKILCLTFTRAAAAEMETRLSERLGSWAIMGDDKLKNELITLLGIKPNSDELLRARKLFAQTLEAPGGLKIRTIHAFCESLLGRFPVEAEVPPNANVMDDRTANEILKEAKSAIYSRASTNQDSYLTQALHDIAGYADEGTFNIVTQELLYKRSKFNAALEICGGLNGLCEAITKQLGLTPDETAQKVLNNSVLEIAFDRNGLHTAVLALENGTRTDKDRAGILKQWLEGDDEYRLSIIEGKYQSIFLKKDGELKTQKSIITKKPSEQSPEAVSALFSEQDRMYKLSERLKAISVAKSTRVLITLASELIGEYERLKRNRMQLDYDDLILKALNLLKKDGGVGWVHFKLDGGIDHILVDEAQDTSPEQWEVINYLASDFFSGESAFDAKSSNATRFHPYRTVFAVGDEKQSIYSFQGADPEGFSRMRNYFQTRAQNVKANFLPVRLKQSFRSTSAILDVVDAVFARPEAQSGVSGNEGIQHFSKRDLHSGVVRLLPSISKTERLDSEPWDAPVDRIRETSPMARTAKNIASMIDTWLTEGEVLKSRNRPIEAGDIMILLHKRGQFMDEMVHRLKIRGIPVAGSDRMVLTDQIAIMDLLAIAQFVLIPSDDLTLAAVLKGPFIALCEEDLFTIAYNREGTLWRSLIGHANHGNHEAQRAHAILSEIMTRANNVPPFEFFSTLLCQDKGRVALVARLGEQANDPIDELLNQTLIFEREHPPSLEGFIAWINAADTQIKRDMDISQGQVRVMTIHGSKGLEANVVILPDTCSEPDGRKSDQILWLQPKKDEPLLLPYWAGTRNNEIGILKQLRENVRSQSLQEYRRLLYVAMTRARDRLYITGWERKSYSSTTGHGRDANSWYEIIHPAINSIDGIIREDTPNGEQITKFTQQRTSPIAENTIAIPLRTIDDPPDWLFSSPPPDQSLPSTLSPSNLEGEDVCVLSPFTDNNTSRYQRGRLIHRMLQTLPEIPENQRLKSAINWLAHSATDLDVSTQLSLAHETIAVLEAPAFIEIFGPESLPEVPICGTIETAQGHRSITGQVDRLLVKEDLITIVDYKTNRPAPTQPSRVPEIYLRQMALYKLALECIYPGRSVRCLLIWTEGPFGMVLDNTQLQRYIP